MNVAIKNSTEKRQRKKKLFLARRDNSQFSIVAGVCTRILVYTYTNVYLCIIRTRSTCLRLHFKAIIYAVIAWLFFIQSIYGYSYSYSYSSGNCLILHCALSNKIQILLLRILGLYQYIRGVVVGKLRAKERNYLCSLIRLYLNIV